MNGFREFLATELQRIGWREFVRRSDGEFTHGAVQGWLRGALPGPVHQIVIATICGVPVERIRDLVWQSEKAREEARHPSPFRPKINGTGSAGAQAPRPRRPQAHPPAVARRQLDTPRRSGPASRRAPTRSHHVDRRRLIGPWEGDGQWQAA